MDTSGSATGATVGRGVSPSAFGQLLRNRSLHLAGGLVMAVAIPFAVLFYFQLRSLSDLGQVSAVGLRQASRETADGIARSIDAALKAPHINVLLRISKAETEPLDLDRISRVFDDSLKTDRFVDRYYVWSDRTTAYRGELLAYDRTSHGFTAGVPEAAALLARIRELSAGQHTIVAFTATAGGRRKHVQARLGFTRPAGGRMTSFVGFAVDAERLRLEFLPSLVSARLHGVQGPTGFPPLVAELTDGSGRVMVPSDGVADLSTVDEREIPLRFFDRERIADAAPLEVQRETWRLRTGYGALTLPALIERRLRPQRLLMAVVAGVMALGMLFVARAAVREVRQAELRSNAVATVSHDLKTPLALIQLFAETLELGRLKNPQRAQEYYRIISGEARKLARIVNNVLDMSRIEAGLRRYKAEPADLTELTRRVIDALQSQIRHAGFTVTSRVAPRVPPVLVDPEAAEQAIENLLSNAMKYSPEHREILVEVDSLDGFGRVSVIDHGIGVPSRLQRRIFRKFYRIQADVGSGAQGTGLGLAIVDHVMRAHGGFVRVDSEPGRGSTFSLHFPISREAQRGKADSGDRGRAADVARSA